jgi:hypothetical protein
VSQLVRPIHRLVLFLASPLTLFLWAEVLYRLSLFRRYGGQPFVNHVNDGYFGWMYLISGLAAVLLAGGLALAVRAAAPLRTILHAAALAVSMAGIQTLMLLHERHLLVTYSEFTRKLGP